MRPGIGAPKGRRVLRIASMCGCEQDAMSFTIQGQFDVSYMKLGDRGCAFLLRSG
jgi:hypothetical protein